MERGGDSRIWQVWSASLESDTLTQEEIGLSSGSRFWSLSESLSRYAVKFWESALCLIVKCLTDTICISLVNPHPYIRRPSPSCIRKLNTRSTLFSSPSPLLTMVSFVFRPKPRSLRSSSVRHDDSASVHKPFPAARAYMHPHPKPYSSLVSQSTPPALNLPLLIHRHVQPFIRSDPQTALQYIYLVCLSADAPGSIGKEQVEQCHEMIREVVLESGAYAELLGDIRADGSKVVSPRSLPRLDQYHQ